MKFDYIIGNPPYLKSTHLEFINKNLDMFTSKLIYIHPSAWLIKNNDRRSTLENDVINTLKEKNVKFTFLNGNKQFNVGLFTPFLITTVSNSTPSSTITINDTTKNKILVFDNIDEINYIDDSKEFLTLKTKILNYSKNNNLTLHNGYNKIDNFNVQIAKMRGHVYTDGRQELLCNDFFTFLPKNYKPETSNLYNKYKLNFGFEKEAEAKNFIKYLNSNFARFCLATTKFEASIQLYLKYVPLPNSSLEKELTSEENKIIDRIIPKYYE
jgi:hypothetical protein